MAVGVLPRATRRPMLTQLVTAGRKARQTTKAARGERLEVAKGHLDRLRQTYSLDVDPASPCPDEELLDWVDGLAVHSPGVGQPPSLAGDTPPGPVRLEEMDEAGLVSWTRELDVDVGGGWELSGVDDMLG